MEDMIAMMFEEISTALGLGCWYECENEWENIEDLIILAGIPEDDVYSYFEELAWEL